MLEKEKTVRIVIKGVCEYHRRRDQSGTRGKYNQSNHSYQDDKDDRNRKMHHVEDPHGYGNSTQVEKTR